MFVNVTAADWRIVCYISPANLLLSQLLAYARNIAPILSHILLSGLQTIWHVDSPHNGSVMRIIHCWWDFIFTSTQYCGIQKIRPHRYAIWENINMYVLHTTNIMAYDDLAMQGVRATVSFKTGCFSLNLLTKWTPFRRRHFQMHFNKWKVSYFD